MSNVIGPNPVPSPSAGDGHSGHAGAAGSSAPSSFSTAYTAALSKLPANPGASALPMQTPAPQSPALRAELPTTQAVKHIPLSPSQQHGTDEHIHEFALKLRAYRLQLIATNIANADTPGYKAVDIDIEEALRNRRFQISDIPLLYPAPRQISLDGNTVEMDVERAKFSETAVMYQFSLDRAMGHYKHMMEMFQMLKD